MGSPQVLVVMPLYNARPYIRTAIESILSQTYPNLSLLVINDGSTDGSEQDAASFQGRAVLLWHQENQGPGVAMNHALQYALDQHIPFLARMDSDDISLPQRLAAQINLLQQYPAAAACSANCYYIESQTEKIIGTSTVSISPRLIRWEINHGLRGLIQGSCVYRTDALAAVGGYRPQYKLAEEVDLFLRLVEKYEVRNCTEFLCKIRIRPNSLSVQSTRQNILYQFYALECAKNRRAGRSEPAFDTFLKVMTWETKLLVWREEKILKLWRNRMGGGLLPDLLLAALLDPRRVVIRGLRKLNDLSHV